VAVWLITFATRIGALIRSLDSPTKSPYAPSSSLPHSLALLALSYAAECGREPVVRLLLDRYGAEADRPDTEGGTPLSCAAEYGHEPIARLLLNRYGVEADKADNEGRTPLSYASDFNVSFSWRLNN
jgi:ankyrin repeat protein